MRCHHATEHSKVCKGGGSKGECLCPREGGGAAAAAVAGVCCVASGRPTAQTAAQEAVPRTRSAPPQGSTIAAKECAHEPGSSAAAAAASAAPGTQEKRGARAGERRPHATAKISAAAAHAPMATRRGRVHCRCGGVPAAKLASSHALAPRPRGTLAAQMGRKADTALPALLTLFSASHRPMPARL